ncbi:MAG: hypothetical protein H7Y05_14390 [Steroidobacteraceae bacterium]|nr:hypothetical protein [Deltaproteobacteria bacterium]
MAIAMAPRVVAVQAGQAPPPTPTIYDHAHRDVIAEDGVKWRRDPFIGAGAKKVSIPTSTILSGKKSAVASSDSPEINLQGILQTNKTFHALIDGRVFKVGDKLGRLTIIEISRYRVVVQNKLKEKNSYDIHKGKINRGEK